MLSFQFERLIGELRASKRDAELLELLTQAMSCLLQHQTPLADQVVY